MNVRGVDSSGVNLGSLDAFSGVKSEPGSFIGATVDARGDHDGSQDPTTIFKVTGEVAVRCYGVCTTTIVGAGSIELGVTGNTAKLIAKIVNATDLIVDEAWLGATPTDVRAFAISDLPATTVLTNGSDIIETLGTADITAGELYYICMWRAITEGSSVVSA